MCFKGAWLTLAFRIEVRVKGLDAIVRRKDKMLHAYRKIPDILTEEVQQAVMGARSVVPVKTGRLRDSIQILDQHLEPPILTVTSGTHVHYAHFVEFGTVKMHQRPFWVPSIWNAVHRIRDRIRTEVMGEGAHG